MRNVRSPPPAGSTASSSSGNLSLSLTIRHLPTDEWTTVRVPVEWRAYDLKRLALGVFDRASESPARTRAPSRPPSERGAADAAFARNHADKENERRGGGANLLSVRGAVHSERETKSPGGVKRFAHALRDRLSSKDLSTVAGNVPTRPSASPLRPLNASIASLSPVPSRHSVSAASTPTRASFNSDTPTRQRVRQSEDTHSRRSSMANFESLHLLSAAARRQDPLEAGGQFNETETLISLDEASPRTARRMERSKSLSEKGSTEGSPVRNRRGLAASTANDDEVNERKLTSWVLVNAITGGTIPDHAIVGSKFVDNDLLTLKPCHLLYEPPLHLYHLPFLQCASASVLSATLSTCRTTFEFSASKGHARRRSFGGGKYGKGDFVERRIEISVDDGVYAATEGDYDMTPGTTMVLKVIKGTQLEAIYPLPAASVQLVASSTTSTSLSFPPPLPTSSSTASLANLVLPSGPSNLRQSLSPVPLSRKKVRSIPLIQLEWDEGESLALRAHDKEEHDRLMNLLGEPQAGDEKKDEAEGQTRKDLIDLAYASRHNLVDPVLSGPVPRARPQNLPRPRLDRASKEHSVARPRIQPRSVSDSYALLPRVPSRSSSLDPHATPSRSSSVLHIRKRESSLELDAGRSSVNRTPSTCTSNSTVSAPSTPTSIRTPVTSEFPPPLPLDPATTPTTTKTSTALSYSPTTNPSPASLMSSSSSYFSLHSPPLTLLPFTYPPPSVAPSSASSSSAFTRAKSSLDLTSAIRTPLSPLGDEPRTTTARSSGGTRSRKAIRRVTSALDASR
ncbi:hypothetical protein JCM11491_002768 [Sporobolomyces phaffii]